MGLTRTSVGIETVGEITKIKKVVGNSSNFFVI